MYHNNHPIALSVNVPSLPPIASGIGVSVSGNNVNANYASIVFHGSRNGGRTLTKFTDNSTLMRCFPKLIPEQPFGVIIKVNKISEGINIVVFLSFSRFTVHLYFIIN